VDIFSAIEMDDQAAASELLAADPTLATAHSDEGATPVLHAMYHQNDDLAHLLAAQIIGAGGQIGLGEAAAIDDVERVQALLAAGADIESRTPDGFTPLQLAAFFGAEQTAAALIAAGANVNTVADNPMQIQPLHAAVANRRTAIGVLLIEAGADVNAAQRHGWTPLHTAALHGDAALIDALIAAGASTTVANDAGRTPIDLATEAGFGDLFTDRS
jgi:ankyrin repeat protein